MDLKDIKELIAMMRKNDLSVFKLEQEGFRITLKRGADFQPVVTQASVPLSLPSTAPSDVAAVEQSSTKSAEKLREITSPMVGTFYSSPSPDSPAYLSVGQEITEDSVVCIVEAMKVMNEIKAECRGVVAEIVAENGKPVQFGQVLFRLR